MDWVFDNLQLLLVIAGAIAYWLNQRRRERAGESADYDGDGVPENRPAAPGADALEEDARTRRIQEEIRRKILERRGGAAPAPAPPPLPVEEPPFMPPLREERPAPVRPSPDEEVLARQRALQERLEALKARRAAAARVRPADFPVAPAIAPSPVIVVRPQHTLLAELRDPGSVRRAIVLREVLGPPVALK